MTVDCGWCVVYYCLVCVWCRTLHEFLGFLHVFDTMSIKWKLHRLIFISVWHLFFLLLHMLLTVYVIMVRNRYLCFKSWKNKSLSLDCCVFKIYPTPPSIYWILSVCFLLDLGFDLSFNVCSKRKEYNLDLHYCFWNTMLQCALVAM